MKTKTATHTPLPWSLKIYEEMPLVEIWSDKRHAPIATQIDEEDAAFIVRAVNAHEVLVTRLHTLIASLESVKVNIEESKGNLGGKQYSIVRMLSNDIAIGKEAIAKAEGR